MARAMSRLPVHRTAVVDSRQTVEQLQSLIDMPMANCAGSIDLNDPISGLHTHADINTAQGRGGWQVHSAVSELARVETKQVARASFTVSSKSHEGLHGN